MIGVLMSFCAARQTDGTIEGIENGTEEKDTAGRIVKDTTAEDRFLLISKSWKINQPTLSTAFHHFCII
jgi:hypothetical protein